MSDRVRFLGRVPHTDLPELLRSADLYVCAPGYEPFGMAALEAAAAPHAASYDWKHITGQIIRVYRTLL